MSNVGQGFGGFGANRRTIRSPINPMDKSTIVSIYPREIDEVKHTIEPGRFHINAGSRDKPSSLVVGTSVWWKDIDPEQPRENDPENPDYHADPRPASESAMEGREKQEEEDDSRRFRHDA